MEIHLIVQYNSTNENFGYNVLSGGAVGARYNTEEERIIARKKIQHAAYEKMIEQDEYAEKMRNKSLLNYYLNKSNKKYMQARSKSNHKSRQKVKQIRDDLRKYYLLASDLFTPTEIDLAFGFTINNKSYKCNSSKKLADLLAEIIRRHKNEERTYKN